MTYWRLITLVALLALAGCASTPQASAERDREAKAFGSHPATAALYVYRPDGANEDTVLWVDDRLIGATLPRAYFVVHVEPGKHVLNGLAGDNGRVTLETRPGEVVFVALRVVSGQSLFERVSPELGRNTLLNCCALLENWAPGQRPLLR
jgi:hypothetical protein